MKLSTKSCQKLGLLIVLVIILVVYLYHNKSTINREQFISDLGRTTHSTNDDHFYISFDDTNIFLINKATGNSFKYPASGSGTARSITSEQSITNYPRSSPPVHITPSAVATIKYCLKVYSCTQFRFFPLQ